MTRAARAGEVALHVQELAQRAAAQQTFDLLYAGQEAPVLPDRQHHAGMLAGVERLGHVGAGERQRLFDEDMLVGSSGGDDLVDMLGMGCRDDHCIDGGVCENRGIVVPDGNPSLAGEIGGLGRSARDGARDPDLARLAMDGADQLLAPAAQTDNGRVQHLATSLQRHRPDG
jgi:hypothetical protein